MFVIENYYGYPSITLLVSSTNTLSHNFKNLCVIQGYFIVMLTTQNLKKK